MIKLGICTGIDNIDKAAAAGFDYIEFNFTALYNMTDDEFEAALKKVEAAPIKVEACNCMIVGGLSVVGPDVDKEKLNAYLEKAFSRAAKMGVQTVVFGSGKARSIPEGFDTKTGWQQVYDYLRFAETFAAKYGITIVIEPLRRQECNIFNFVSEAIQAACAVDLPHIAVLGDTYHMAAGNEPFEIFKLAGGLLKHVHIANPVTRACPAPDDGIDYSEVFNPLKEMGYTYRVSVEASLKDFDSEVGPAFKCLDSYR